MREGTGGRVSLPERAVHVEAMVRHQIGSLEVQAELRLDAPWTVLFGPSGSGKSTILRIIAGLIRPKWGHVALTGDVVLDTDAKICVPAYKRPMRWAGQKEMLFPRKTVRWNMPLGMNVRDPKLGGERMQLDEMERAIQHFGLQRFADKLPGELSGGERQRVAVARAAVGARGRVLLLDEPFAGLDARVREEFIEQLKGWMKGTPVVSVTHDVGEAFLLGAEVVRMIEGQVVAQGAVGVVLAVERDGLRTVLDQ